MKTSQFETLWEATIKGGKRISEGQLCLVQSVFPLRDSSEDLLIFYAIDNNPTRYTKMLIRVCGVPWWEGDYFHYRNIDLQKIATATPEQRLKAAGLMGCEDD